MRAGRTTPGGSITRYCCACRAQLDPRPGQIFAAAPQNYVLPDVTVEKIDGPILLDCGGQDILIPSCPFGIAIEDRLNSMHFRFSHQFVTYQDAGHWVNAGVPYRPVFDITAFGVNVATRNQTEAAPH